MQATRDIFCKLLHFSTSRKLLLSASLFLSVNMVVFTSTAQDVQDKAVFYRSRSTAIVDKLIKQGYRKFHEVDLYELKEKIPQVSWRKAAPGEVTPDFAGQRGSAFYLRDHKEVTIMAEPRDFTQESNDILSLHEALGALGYKDKNYEISLWLYHLESTNTGIKTIVKFSHPYKWNQVDGGTSVGGGGDMTGLTVKLKVLEKIWQRHTMWSDYLQFYFHMPFEPNNNTKDQTIKYSWGASDMSREDYEYDIRPGNKEYPSYSPRQVTEVQVPVLAWKKASEKERERILTSIADTIIRHANKGISKWDR